ncbi:MFS transporter [Chloroflexota bacterium]
MSSEAKNNTPIFYGWVIVAVTLIAGAILLGTRQSYGVFFKSIGSDFGMSRAVTSGVFSVYMAFSAICSVLGGWSLDKFGPKWTIAAMGFFTGLSLLLTSQVHSVWQLYLTYSLILAAGTGATYTMIGAAVSRWFEKKRGLALGISQAGGGIGLLIGAPFATYLIVSFDWRTAYIVIGIIALLLVIGPAILLKGYPSEIGLLPDGDKPRAAQNQAQIRKAVKPDGFTVKETIRTRQFWLLFLIWLLHGTASYIITTHIVNHATDVGIPAINAATILSAFALFNILGGLVVGAFSDTLGRKTISIICELMGTGALFWLMWMPNNLWLFYAFAALFGIPFGGIPTMVNALAGDMFGMRHIGKIMGWMSVSWFTGAAIGPLIAGAIYDIYKSYFFAFLIGSICMLLAIVFLAMLTKPKMVATSALN